MTENDDLNIDLKKKTHLDLLILMEKPRVLLIHNLSSP
jgi:hypothetical protein